MSCLFRSLSHHVYNLGTEELRQMICNYLESDPSIMGEKFSNWLVILQQNPSSIPLSIPLSPLSSSQHLKDYVQSMRRPSTWGGGIEINSFCELFDTRVMVHHHMGRLENRLNNPSSFYLRKTIINIPFIFLTMEFITNPCILNKRISNKKIDSS